MIDIKVTPIRPWKFGAICEGCGAPCIPFCPCCGADLFTVGHGAVSGRGLPGGYKLAVCDDCIDKFNLGMEPGPDGAYLEPRRCE